MLLEKPAPVSHVLQRTRLALLVFGLTIVTSISWVEEQGAFYSKHFFPWGIEAIGMNLGFKTGREMKNLGPTGLVLAAAQAPVNAAKSAYLGDALPLLRIDMKFKNYTILRTLRSRAIKRGILTSTERRFLPIVIQLGDHAVEAKARLTGGQIDHIQHLNKWSLRIRTKKGHHDFGMRRFSLRHPKTRGFHAEPLVGEVLRTQGILVPRYRFVRVELNGEALGVMAAEESFVKEMVESQARKEAPILYHDYTIKRENAYTARPTAFHLSDRAMPIKSQMLKGGTRIPSSFDAAIGRLRSWEEGTSKASEVFDRELWGRFIATCEYFGIKHGLHFYNQRFYYNPMTGWLEPVAYDLNPHQTVWEKHLDHLALSIEDQQYEYGVQSLHEPAVWAAYVSSLENLIFQMEEGTLGTQIKDLQNQYIEQIYVNGHIYHIMRWWETRIYKNGNWRRKTGINWPSE